MHAFREEFLAFSLARDVLKFGDFVTKAGRNSPYFFNAGLFDDGESLRRLGGFYADALLASGIVFDQLFGPAYKGITLAAATAIALAEKGHNLPFSYNRKEAKDHGEGGVIVGAPLRGRVVIVDDVITDGAAKRESIETIRAQGGQAVAVLIALDRKERGQGKTSAVQELQAQFGVPVVSIATLDDVMAFVAGRPELGAARGADRGVSRASTARLIAGRGREQRGKTAERSKARKGENVSARRSPESSSPAGERRACVARRRDPRAFVIPALAVALALAIVGSVAPARAATYKWVDDKGVVHYTDKIPQEALNKGSTVLDKQARPVKKIDPGGNARAGSAHARPRRRTGG